MSLPLIVSGVLAVVLANVGVWRFVFRIHWIRQGDLATAEANRMWWANEASIRDGLLAEAAREIAQLKADLLAATEEKTALRRSRDELIVGSPEESP